MQIDGRLLPKRLPAPAPEERELHTPEGGGDNFTVTFVFLFTSADMLILGAASPHLWQVQGLVPVLGNGGSCRVHQGLHAEN